MGGWTRACSLLLPSPPCSLRPRFRLQAVSAAGQSPFGLTSTFTTLGLDEAEVEAQALTRRKNAQLAQSEFASADPHKLLLAKQRKRAEARGRADWKRTKQRIIKFSIIFTMVGVMILGILFAADII